MYARARERSTPSLSPLHIHISYCHINRVAPGYPARLYHIYQAAAAAAAVVRENRGYIEGGALRKCFLYFFLLIL